MTDHDSGEDRTEADLQNLYSALSQVTNRAADAGFNPATGLARFTAWLNDRPQTGSPDQTEALAAGTESARTDNKERLPSGQRHSAVRLIATSRHALATSTEAPTVMAEAWQAQALAQAIGNRLALSGPPELRAQALGLSELAGQGCTVLGTPPLEPGALRADQLAELDDPRETLYNLGYLLGEVGIGLVGVASAAGDEGTYWRCMEALDAADESRDRVLEMLRLLAAQDQAVVKRGSAAG
ncbi:hypothetical protein QFZ24_009976 [Streptomyces phaeochromogenes]|jgi:hypothetical protein|nr:hypothetical protein [Streptomyces phaeochromogenes]